jgi:two-component system chemotaxis response regulator CheB
MLSRKIKVLIIDDSAFMRKSLSLMLGSDPEIEVVGTARDGFEGIELTKRLSPDLITLDIEMPKMDGLTALQKIMAENPTPVIMVSSLTMDGADATIKALELGAIDFISKETSFVSVNIIKIKEDLLQKVKLIVRQKEIKERLNRLRGIRQKYTVELSKAQTGTEILPERIYKAIALGISTGGPLSLQKIIPKLSKHINCPIFIVQHMPPKFTKSLAERLNGMCALEVKEAENAEIVRNSVIYIAPGGFHMIIENGSPGIIRTKISEEPADTLHRPSVDVMMNSVIKIYGKNTLGIIMTGMGKDGFEAIKELKNIGGVSLAQDEESCVVYGMPRAIIDGQLADIVAPLEKIPQLINMAF